MNKPAVLVLGAESSVAEDSRAGLGRAFKAPGLSNSSSKPTVDHVGLYSICV